MWCQTTYVGRTPIDPHNRSLGYEVELLGEDEWYDTYDTIGRLFRECQQSYGRCTSSMYIDDGVKVGWVFEKKRKSEGGQPDEWYIAETWVQVSITEPTKIPAHYENITSPWQ